MAVRIERILVPTDFSIPSREALDYATALAASLGASINLLHVVHDPFAVHGAWEVYIPESPQVREAAREQARTRLAELAKQVGEAGVTVFTDIRFGNAVDEINAAAVDCRSDLIVMSTHGRTGLSHLLLGSIAERVLRTAPCPVLAVRHAVVEPRVEARIPATA